MKSKFQVNMSLKHIWIAGLLIWLAIGNVGAIGQFSISFDDGNVNTSTVYFPIMQSRGIVGTVYGQNSVINTTAAYQNWSQLLELQNAGWEIGSHTYSHAQLNNTSTNFTHELGGSITELENNGLYVSTIAYPQGYYTQNTLQQVMTYFMGARPVVFSFITSANLEDSAFKNDKYQLGTYHIGDTGAATTQAIFDLINQSVANNTWLSIYCHDAECDTASVNFTAIMDYVSSEQTAGNLTVITIRDGIEEYREQAINSNIQTANHTINYVTSQQTAVNLYPYYNNTFNFKQDVFNLTIDIIGRNVTNLVPNPGFESGLTGWSLDTGNASNVSVVLDTTTSVSGSNSVNISNFNSTNDYVYYRSPFIPVTPSTTYSIYAYINTSNLACSENSNGKANIRVNYYYPNNTQISGIDKLWVGITGTNTWDRYIVTPLSNYAPFVTTPSVATQVRIYLSTSYCTGTVLFDNVMMVQGVRTPPFIIGSNNTAVSPSVNLNNYTYNLPDLDDNETYSITNFTDLIISNVTGTTTGSGDFDYKIYGKRYFNAVHSWVNRSSNGSYYVEKVFFSPNASVEFWDNQTILRYNNFNFKIRPNIHATIGTMTIIPTDNITVNVTTWNTTGDYYKKWNESSSNTSTTTQHIIGDFPANTNIQIKRDGINYAQLTSNSTGYINWTYSGGYSEHQFEAEILGAEAASANTWENDTQAIDLWVDISGVLKLTIFGLILSFIFIVINSGVTNKTMWQLVTICIGIVALVVIYALIPIIGSLLSELV